MERWDCCITMRGPACHRGGPAGAQLACHEQSRPHSSCASDGASPEHEWRSIAVIMESPSSPGPLGMATQLKLMLQVCLASIVLLPFRQLQVGDG